MLVVVLLVVLEDELPLFLIIEDIWIAGMWTTVEIAATATGLPPDYKQFKVVKVLI